MRFDRSDIWEVFPTVVFTHGEDADEESFLWTTIKTKGTESILHYIPGRPYSIKEILLNFGLRKVGIVGTGDKSRILRVKCPYCSKIQELIDESQTCASCNKQFYLY